MGIRAPIEHVWAFDNILPDLSGTGHLHWTIQAFAWITDDGQLQDVVTVQVEAPTEDAAIARAQAIIQRENYRVALVAETCSLDPALRPVRAADDGR